VDVAGPVGARVDVEDTDVAAGGHAGTPFGVKVGCCGEGGPGHAGPLAPRVRVRPAMHVPQGGRAGWRQHRDAGALVRVLPPDGWHEAANCALAPAHSGECPWLGAWVPGQVGWASTPKPSR
jgi:hypothetical protein